MNRLHDIGGGGESKDYRVRQVRWKSENPSMHLGFGLAVRFILESSRSPLLLTPQSPTPCICIGFPLLLMPLELACSVRMESLFCDVTKGH